MTFKTLITAAGIMTLLLQAPATMADTHGKARPDLNTQFEVQHDIREAERRAIVASNLQLSNEESEKFWPLYDAYRTKIKDQEKAGQDLLLRIAKTFDNVPEDEARDMVIEALSLETAVQDISKTHITELQGVLSGAKLFRYFQINSRLNAMFTYQLTKKIPLMPAEGNGITVIEVQESE